MPVKDALLGIKGMGTVVKRGTSRGSTGHKKYLVLCHTKL